MKPHPALALGIPLHLFAILACTPATPTTGAGTPPASEFLPTPSLAKTAALAPTASPSLDTVPPPENQIGPHISAVNPVTIYSGPGNQHPPLGVLDAGVAAGVIGETEGDYWPDRWLNISCPEGTAGECWVLWDMNALFFYEGPPVTLNIPDPATLKIETNRTDTSPDGSWQVQSTESEAVALGPEEASYFYVEFTVTSLADGASWTPVSEWHAYGLGLETAPRPFHWSQDGRYLYYTSLVVPDGGCGFFANSGESLDRLDLTDGAVSAMQPPHSRWILAISPDENRMAYLSYQDGYILVVRDLEGAYTQGTTGDYSIQWQVPLEVIPPEVVSQITWSLDNQRVLLTVTEVAPNCQPAKATEWRLDVATGEFVEASTTIFPTPTP